MRYRDAAHVGLGSFYMRRPEVGKAYRFIGYAGVVAAVAAGDRTGCVAWVLVALLLAWLAAWYQIVGALWRSALVAGVLVCAVKLTLLRVCGTSACAW